MELSYDEPIIRRHAEKAAANGCLPQPLTKHLKWFVVDEGKHEGGRGCGYNKRRVSSASGLPV